MSTFSFCVMMVSCVPTCVTKNEHFLILCQVFMVFHGSRLVFIVFHDFGLVFHGSWSVVMVPGWFSWFLVGFHSFHSSRLVFHCSKLVFHASRLFFMVFHCSSSVFKVFHGSMLVFHGFLWLFMVPGWFSWFFMVPGCFFMVFLQNVPAQTVSWPNDPV